MKRLTTDAKDLIARALLVLATVLCFLHTLDYPFLAFWDDASYVTENPLIALTPENIAYFFTHTKHSLYTPITMFSFMTDYALSHDPMIFRIHNLFAHCITAVFFFLILRKFGMRTKASFFFALFWAIHPQKVESVCWISERKDVLCGMFAFASFYVFLLCMQCKDRRWPWLSAVAGVLCVLSIFSKPASLTLPGLFVLYPIAGFLRSGRINRGKIRKALPAILIGGIGALWSARITSSVNPPALIDDWTLPVHNYFWYITSILFPNISPIHAYRTTALGPFDSIYQLLGAVLFTVFLHLLWIFSPSRVRKSIVSVALVIIAARPVVVRFVPMLTPAYYIILAATVLLFISQIIGIKNLLLWAAAIFIIAFPVLGLHKSTFFEWCDRYNYLVSAVTIGLVAIIFRRAGHSLRKMQREGELFSGSGIRLIPWALLIMVFSIYGAATIVYSQEWRSEELLFKDALNNRMDDDAIPHLKAVEMCMTSAIVRSNPDDLAEANEYLQKHRALYLKKFAEYLQIWEHIGGANEQSIRFATIFCHVYERFLRGESVGQDLWSGVVDSYPAGVPVFCENFIIPSLLGALLKSEAYPAFDKMLGKINPDAVSPELIEYRRLHGPAED